MKRTKVLTKGENMYLEFSINDIQLGNLEELKNLLTKECTAEPVKELESTSNKEMRIFSYDHKVSMPYSISALYVDNYYDDNSKDVYAVCANHNGWSSEFAKYYDLEEAIEAIKKCQEKYEEGYASWVIGG